MSMVPWVSYKPGTWLIDEFQIAFFMSCLLLRVWAHHFCRYFQCHLSYHQQFVWYPGYHGYQFCAPLTLIIMSRVASHSSSPSPTSVVNLRHLSTSCIASCMILLVSSVSVRLLSSSLHLFIYCNSPWIHLHPLLIGAMKSLPSSMYLMYFSM